MKNAVLFGSLLSLSVSLSGCGAPEAPPAPPVADQQHAIIDPACYRLPSELAQVQAALANVLAKAQSNCNAFCVTGMNWPYAKGALNMAQDAITQANSAVPWAASAAAGVASHGGIVMQNAEKITSALTGHGGADWQFAISAIYDHGPDAYAGLQLLAPTQKLVTTLQIDAALCYVGAYYHP